MWAAILTRSIALIMVRLLSHIGAETSSAGFCIAVAEMAPGLFL